MDQHEKPTRETADRIVGFIEVLDESGIHGWAYDREDLSEAATLRFYIDEVFVSTALCEAVRTDVESAGHPRAEVGFHVSFPREVFDDTVHSYHFTTRTGEPVSLIKLGDKLSVHRTFRFTSYFDAEFYRRYYPDARGMTDIAAFRHWSGFVAPVQRHPSEDSLFAKLAEDGQAIPDDFSPMLYRFLNRDIAGSIELDWEARAHYLESGRVDGRIYGFSRNSFLVDLYFGGVPPSAAVLDVFLAENRRTLYVSLDDLLARNGITSDTPLRRLNVGDYVASNSGAGLKTQLQCLRHFAETGCKAGQPLAFDCYFDQKFAAQFDPNYAELSPEEAYLTWVNTGDEEEIAPNHHLFLRGLGLSETSGFPAGFNADIYIAMNPELRVECLSQWHALRHLMEKGLAEGRRGCPVGPGSRDIYRTVADRCAVANHLPAARRLYEMLLAEDPVNVMAQRHYGDCLLRQGDLFLAARTYEDTIASGADNIWTHLNLVTCYTRQGRWAEACRVIGRLSAARPGDRAVQRRYREVLKDSHSALAGEADWLAKQKFYDEGRERLQLACDLLRAPVEVRGPSKSRRAVASVAMIADLGLPQCKFYRVDQKVEQFEAAGIKCKVVNYTTDIVRFVRESIWLDAVIFYRVGATPDVMWCIRLLRQAGVPVFFEIDDLMFDPELFPDSFQSYGGRIKHDSYAQLINGTISLRTALSACDYAIGSTPALAEAMENLVGARRAFVHRNSLSKRHQDSYEASVATVERDKITIFYGSGTHAHNEDFELHVAAPLCRLLGKWGSKLELFIMGHLTLPRSLSVYQDQITVQPPIWDLRTYWNVLRGADISIAVLKPGAVADCKSEIKWMEAAMLGVPSVVTATRTYAEVIDDGTTGVLIGGESEWYSRLDALIEDQAARLALGRAARDVVLDRYSVKSQSANLVAILDAVAVAPAAAKRRLLIVNVFYPPQSVGGATRVVADNVSDILASYGDEFDVEIFTTLEGGTEAYLPLVYIEDGVRVTAIPAGSDADRRIWDTEMAECFEQVVANFQPDLVHLHCIQRVTLSACDVLRRQMIPYVVTVHDGWWISETQFLTDEYGQLCVYDYADPMNEFRRGDAARLERMQLKQEYLSAAAKVFAVSEPFAEIYRSCGFTNVIAVSNGVSSLDVLPRVAAPDGRVRLAHIGGASFHKGYHLVRTALSQGKFENLHLLVIDHAMDPTAERHSVWGATEVTFRGKIAQSKVAELYCGVDVLLAPSIWPESYGLVTREAAMAGCWVVASDRGAVGGDVTAETGFVIDVSNVDAITEVFQTLNDDPARFTTSPGIMPPLRRAREQVDDLVLHYRALCPSKKTSSSMKRRAKKL